MANPDEPVDLRSDTVTTPTPEMREAMADKMADAVNHKIAKRFAKAGPDPWDAWTLEWSVSSPPPAYNFASIPVVGSRRPLWDRKHPEDPDSRYE